MQRLRCQVRCIRQSRGRSGGATRSDSLILDRCAAVGAGWQRDIYGPPPIISISTSTSLCARAKVGLK
jgi:hypothetical protein